MIYVDCRKCKNLKPDKSGCIFGDDVDIAIKKCIDSGFIFYQPVKSNLDKPNKRMIK